MTEEITLEDMRKALDLCKTEMSTKTLEFDWGFIEMEGFSAKTIKLKPEAYKKIREVCQTKTLDKQNLVRVETFYGVPVVREMD